MPLRGKFVCSAGSLLALAAMAERQDIANLVRRIVGAIGNLPNTNESGSNVQLGNGSSFTNVDLEVNEHFQIPHTSSSSCSSGRVIPRARSGRFVPYARRNTTAKKKSSENDVFMKDVSLA